MITTVAGSGVPGFDGDNGSASIAQLNDPEAVSIDRSGNLYIADTRNYRIRKVSAGIITSIAGNGMTGFSGSNVSASSAQLFLPQSILTGAAGEVYFSDSSHRIHKIVDSVISVIAGNGFAGNGSFGFEGDDGPATRAPLDFPYRIAFDANGSLYIAEAGNNRIRKVSNGVITTIAGIGPEGFFASSPPTFGGDGGPADNAELNRPAGVAIDTRGNVYIADSNNHRIRLLTSASSTCSYFLAPTIASAPPQGVTLSIGLQTSSGCTWTIAGLPAWITVPAGISGSGAANLRLTVAANTGAARSATITAGGAEVTINQASGTSGCTYSISPGGQVFSGAGSGTIAVTTSSGCSWTANSSLPWVTITGGSSGTGDGTLTYRLLSNPGATRTGTLTIGGLPFRIEQLGVLPAGLVSIGTMPQVASGGGWKTTFSFTNIGETVAEMRLILTGDSGTSLTLPLMLPQTSVGPLLAETLERTLKPSEVLVVECEGPVTQDAQQGWARVMSNGSITAFAIFSFKSGSSEHEAVVPLETRTASGHLLTFDNTKGVQNGVAIANLSPNFVPATVVIKDESGTLMQTNSLNLSARGHTAFLLSSMYPVVNLRRGTIEFRSPEGSQLSVLGLRFNNGPFTSIPVAVK